MMTFLARLVRVLFLLLVARAAIIAIARWLRLRPAAPAAPPTAGGDLVRDRICNTFLPRDRALRATVDRGEEYFCSPACRDRAALSRAS